jgi:MYXO-CTERM domain-containing protein
MRGESIVSRALAVVAGAAVCFVGAVAHAGSYSNDFSSGLNGARLTGDAVLDAGTVLLTNNENDRQGSLFLPDLDPGQVVRSFNASFNLATGPGTDPPADGISFFFGPNTTGTFGEEGPGQGLVFSFDTYENGGGEGRLIDIFVDGVIVTRADVNPYTNGQFVPVSVVLNDSDLSLTFAGQPVLTDGRITLPRAAGYVFGFGGRTGGLNEQNRIDNILITTTPVPEPAALGTLGLAALLGLRRRRRTS